MKLLRRTSVVFAGLLLTAGACRGQDLGNVWSEWETWAVEQRGPGRASGLLVYFQDENPDAIQGPLPILFTEMARIAQWDILRINRRPSADLESQDDDILRFVAERIARARQDGYREIIVAGFSRGGWLALSAATLPGVDAAIGLAPAMTSFERTELERTRDRLARKLAGAKAKRIAAFFFAGDPHEDVAERRAAAVRRALQQSGSSFMVVDRPPDLQGPSAAAGGRFVRRYRDCLLQFVRNVHEPAGEVQCSRSSGYAIGAEIDFPPSVPALKLPAHADPAFAPYLGRWEGDDESGAYLIMESVEYRWNATVLFRTGYSVGPGGSSLGNGTTDVPFHLAPAQGLIYSKFAAGDDIGTARLKSPTELDYEVRFRSHGRQHIWRFLLRKRAAQPADR